MKNRKYYEELFIDYPDVVDTRLFREMLGGISDKTVQKLISQGYVQHFTIRGAYRIPKKYVIDYILSKHYAEYSKKLKVQI